MVHPAHDRVFGRPRACGGAVSWPACRAPPSSHRPRRPRSGAAACAGTSASRSPEPFVGSGYCHCTHCQRRTGTAASASARVGRSGFRLLPGAERLETFQPTPESNPKVFCRRCGSHLFSGDPFAGEHVAIRLGVLDADPGIRPQWHQWVDSAGRLGVDPGRRPPALRRSAHRLTAPRRAARPRGRARTGVQAFARSLGGRDNRAMRTVPAAVTEIPRRGTKPGTSMPNARGASSVRPSRPPGAPPCTSRYTCRSVDAYCHSPPRWPSAPSLSARRPSPRPRRACSPPELVTTRR